MKTIQQLRKAIEASPARSPWSKGVKLYALELIEDMEATREFYASPADKKDLLNGADDWSQFSYGGCSLIYNQDIAERLCSLSGYKRTEEGKNPPNARENWLDVQARALYQAYALICKLAKE